MRLLHVTPELPYWPRGSGGSTRQYHLLRRLVELGHEVTVVAPVAPAQREAASSLKRAGIRLVAANRPGSRVLETARALGRDPRLAARAVAWPVLAWQVGVFWAALRPLAVAEIERARPDAISVEHDNAVAWARDLPGGIPRVLVLQNVGWDYYASRAAATGGLAGAALRAEGRRFRRLDRARLGDHDRLVAVSEPDRDELARETSLPIDVVPNGVAAAELAALPESKEAATVLFTGTLAYPPNAEGIAWFARSAWPRVRERLPDARLLVVGRDPPSSVTALREVAGVEVVGSVPEMAPWFGRATAVVAPLLSGGGTRLKILEAWARRRAVVATPVAAAGLGARDGHDLLLASDPGALADSVVRALEDGSLRERLAAAGRERAEREYDWDVLGERLEAALEAACAGVSSAPR